MWPFTPRQAESSSTLTRISELESRCKTLEAGRKALELEWEDVYERLRKAAARLNQRVRDDEARDKKLEDAPGPTNGHQAMTAYVPDRDLLRQAFPRR